MRDQQLERELEALDQSLEKLHEKLNFRIVRLEALIPGPLQDCVAKGISLAAVALRRTLFGATYGGSLRGRGARNGIDMSASSAFQQGQPRHYRPLAP